MSFQTRAVWKTDADELFSAATYRVQRQFKCVGTEEIAVLDPNVCWTSGSVGSYQSSFLSYVL